MSLLSTCRSRWRALVRRSAVEREMDEELRFHLEMQERAFRDAGLHAGEARDAALRRFGGLDQSRERARDQRGWAWLDRLRQDVRYAARTLSRSPGFTLTAVVSLTLGIGANTALFSLLNAALFRPLPVRQPGALRAVYWEGHQVQLSHYSGSGRRMTAAGARQSASFPYAAYRDFRDGIATLGQVFAYTRLPAFTVQAGDEAAVADGLMVSGNFFAAYGADTLLGRPLSPADDRPRAPAAAVVTWRWWQRHFGGDPGAVGRTMLVNRVPFTVVGVLRREYAGPLLGDSADFYVPLSSQPQLQPSWPLDSYHHWWVEMMVRLAPGVDDRQVMSALDVLFTRTLEAPGGKTRMERPRVLLEDGSQGPLLGRERLARPLYALLAAVSVLLLVACANLASLLLARGAARRHEFALRAALGAGRRRLVRQCLTETLVLSAAGAAFGLLFAEYGKVVLLRLLVGSPDNFHLDPTLDARVLAFTALVATATALLGGILPALRSTTANLANALASRGGTGAPRLAPGRVLVCAQIALSLAAVVAAGLLARTLSNLQRVDPGFATRNLLLVGASGDRAGYAGDRMAGLYEDLAGSFASVPGVTSVTFSSLPLLRGSSATLGVKIPGRAVRSDEAGQVTVGDGFFHTIGLPLVLGRELDARDTASAPGALVVNESFARVFFEGDSPMGQTVMVGRDEYRVVGVCRDALFQDLRAGTEPVMFLPFRQATPASVVFEIRTSVEPASLVPTIRRVARGIDRNLPLTDIKTQGEQVAELLTLDRAFAVLCGFVALLALLLSCAGLHGLMAYGVARRTSEIGIRMALGARPADVARGVVGQALATAAAGIVAGAAAAAALGRIIENRLFGVTSHDPAVLGTSALLLLAVAFVSSYVPARRASRVDPLTALKAE